MKIWKLKVKLKLWKAAWERNLISSYNAWNVDWILPVAWVTWGLCSSVRKWLFLVFKSVSLGLPFIFPSKETEAIDSNITNQSQRLDFSEPVQGTEATSLKIKTDVYCFSSLKSKGFRNNKSRSGTVLWSENQFLSASVLSFSISIVKNNAWSKVCHSQLNWGHHRDLERRVMVERHKSPGSLHQ